MACCLAFALSSCSGGAVSVRSNFSGSGAPLSVSGPAPVPAVSGPPGLTAHYASSGNLGFAVLGVLIVADILHWTSAMFRQAFGMETQANAENIDRGVILPKPKKCVYPVPEMC